MVHIHVTVTASDVLRLAFAVVAKSDDLMDAGHITRRRSSVPGSLVADANVLRSEADEVDVAGKERALHVLKLAQRASRPTLFPASPE